MAKEEAVDDFIGQITSQYSEAIDLLTGKPINYERFAVEVAKSSPGLFVKIAKSIQFEDEAPITRKRNLFYEQESERINRYLADLIRSNKKVEAIKAYRTMTGTGLKEAKDYCDALQTVDQVERDSEVASW